MGKENTGIVSCTSEKRNNQDRGGDKFTAEYPGCFFMVDGYFRSVKCFALQCLKLIISFRALRYFWYNYFFLSAAQKILLGFPQMQYKSRKGKCIQIFKVNDYIPSSVIDSQGVHILLLTNNQTLTFSYIEVFCKSGLRKVTELCIKSS